MIHQVLVAHSAEDDVWFVHSSNVPGLNAEAASLDSLIDIINDLAPQLLTANGGGNFNSSRFQVLCCDS